MNNTPHAENLVGSPDAGPQGRRAPEGFSTTRSLLTHYVEMLGLNRHRAWPSKVQDTKDAIKQWRSEQRMKLVGDQ